MTVRRQRIEATVAADGSLTTYSGYVSGYLDSIQYVKSTYADTVDFTITAEATGETLWTEANVTASKVCRPRGAIHSTAGVGGIYATGGIAVTDRIALGRDRVKIVLASGGVSTTGSFIIVVDDGRGMRA